MPVGRMFMSVFLSQDAASLASSLQQVQTA
jgi:hypothetical protein